MRIAVPVTGSVLSSHFGHCERFVLFDVYEDRKNPCGSSWCATEDQHNGTGFYRTEVPHGFILGKI